MVNTLSAASFYSTHTVKSYFLPEPLLLTEFPGKNIKPGIHQDICYNRRKVQQVTNTSEQNEYNSEHIIKMTDYHDCKQLVLVDTEPCQSLCFSRIIENGWMGVAFDTAACMYQNIRRLVAILSYILVRREVTS
jgi:hypothetical protein